MLPSVTLAESNEIHGESNVYGAEIEDTKRAKELVLMTSLNKTIDQLVMESRVR